MVIDRGAVDYKLFGDWTEDGVYFVTRLKDKASYRVVKRLRVPENRHILKDQIIRFTGFYAERDCPYLLRKIEAWDRKKRTDHPFNQSSGVWSDYHLGNLQGQMANRNLF